MILESIRSVADGLRDPATGVNAQLATLAIEVGDIRPSAVASIIDQVTSDEAALDRFVTADGGCIQVMGSEGTDLDPEDMSDIRDGRVAIRIAFLTRDIDPTVNATTSFYVLRAIQKAIRAWLRNDNASVRTRNDIEVISCTAMTHSVLNSVIDDVTTKCTLSLTLYCRDMNP